MRLIEPSSDRPNAAATHDPRSVFEFFLKSSRPPQTMSRGGRFFIVEFSRQSAFYHRAKATLLFPFTRNVLPIAQQDNLLEIVPHCVVQRLVGRYTLYP